MHQYLFFIGDFPLRSYGMILSISIILATGVGYFLAKQHGNGYEKHIVDMGIYCGIAGLLGARLWDVFFFDWSYYGNHITEIFNVWQGGMAIQGGILFGVMAGVVYTKYHELNTFVMADILAPAIVFGQGLGRAANLMNGDAFGAPTGEGFGIIYPNTTLAFATYGNKPLWPAEVWESQLDFVIFALLLIFRSFKHRAGQAFCLYVMLYSCVRFGLEFLRGDYTNIVVEGLKSAQVTAVIMLVLGAIGFVWCRRRNT